MSAKIKSLEAKVNGLKAVLDQMDEDQINRSTAFTDEEQAVYTETSEQLERASDELETAKKLEDKVQRSLALGVQAGVGANGQGGVKVNKVEPIYRADSKHNFLNDLILRTRNNDYEAAQRIGEWTKINRAAATSSELAGIVVPQYLTDELIGLAKEGRPFLNVLRSNPVRGMTTILPRVVTSPTAAAQATENTAVDSTALDTEEVSIGTKTVAGYTDLSVQAVDFGAFSEEWVFGQLLEDLYTKMDYYALHGTDSNGQPEGLFASDGTNVIQGDALGNGSAADKFGELYAVVRQGAGLIRQQDKRNATHVVMSANRWYAISSALDSEGRPLLGWADSAPQNVGGTWTGPTFAGLPVVADENVVMTGEFDTFMAVIAAPSIWFAESSPVQLTCECVVAHTGSVRFVLRAYMQFSAEVRPKSVTIIEDLPVPEYPTEGGLS